MGKLICQRCETHLTEENKLNSYQCGECGYDEFEFITDEDDS